MSSRRPKYTSTWEGRALLLVFHCVAVSSVLVIMVDARALPPLLGDGNGRYRVHMVGNSGEQKELARQANILRSWEGWLSCSIFVFQSTTGAALAAMLGLPYIALDRLYWKPNWEKSSLEEFQGKLRAALDQNDRGWVADGNFDRLGGVLAFEESTDVIWMDPPFYVYFPRIVLRTFQRLLEFAPPCSPGCDERFSEVFSFSEKSILWWSWTNHAKTQETNKARMALIGIEAGSDIARRRMRRFGGWGGEVKAWLQDIAKMVKSKSQKVD